MKGKIFNTQEVQAIIAGNKTQFRQICKKQPKGELEQPYVIRNMGIGRFHYPFGKIPYKVGQRIFVKEKWGIGSRPDQFGGYKGFEYEADCFVDNEDLPCYEIDYDKLPKNIEIDNWIGNWEQARLMPEWASRLTLEITEVKIERLQSISQEDCAKEGIPHAMWQANGRFFSAPGEPIEIGFAGNWNSTHKKPEEKFGANPFVWVVDFKINK